MTKQDFELIAATLRGWHGAMPDTLHDTLSRDFAFQLAGTNPRFDRARFLAACKGEDSTDSAGRAVRYSAA